MISFMSSMNNNINHNHMAAADYNNHNRAKLSSSLNANSNSNSNHLEDSNNYYPGAPNLNVNSQYYQSNENSGSNYVTNNQYLQYHSTLSDPSDRYTNGTNIQLNSYQPSPSPQPQSQSHTQYQLHPMQYQQMQQYQMNQNQCQHVYQQQSQFHYQAKYPPVSTELNNTMNTEKSSFEPKEISNNFQNITDMSPQPYQSHLQNYHHQHQQQSSQFRKASISSYSAPFSNDADSDINLSIPPLKHEQETQYSQLVPNNNEYFPVINPIDYDQSTSQQIISFPDTISNYPINGHHDQPSDASSIPSISSPSNSYDVRSYSSTSERTSVPMDCDENGHFTASTSISPVLVPQLVRQSSTGSNTIMKGAKKSKSKKLLKSKQLLKHVPCPYEDCKYSGMFASKEYLRRHIREQHNLQRSHNCEGIDANGSRWGCGRSFKRPYQLIYHWRGDRSLKKCNVPSHLLEEANITTNQ